MREMALEIGAVLAPVQIVGFRPKVHQPLGFRGKLHQVLDKWESPVNFQVLAQSTAEQFSRSYRYTLIFGGDNERGKTKI